MKKITLISLAVFASLSWQSCKDDELSIGAPADSVEGLSMAPWRITEAFLVDEASPARDEKNVSSSIINSDNRLTLDFHADGTFNVMPGDGMNPFPLSGTWAFDTNEAPSRIYLTSDGQITEVPLGAPVRPVDRKLQINFVKRYCPVDGGLKPVLGYRFVFERQQ